MPMNWKAGGLLLGLVFFLAVLLVKPIGVSTQFVILDGILGDVVNTELVTQTEEGYTSTNAYLAKSGGKYAKSVANPLNYSFVFVLAMALGGIGGSRRIRVCPAQQAAHRVRRHVEAAAQRAVKLALRVRPEASRHV